MNYVVQTGVMGDVHWMVFLEGHFLWDVGTCLDGSQDSVLVLLGKLIP